MAQLVISFLEPGEIIRFQLAIGPDAPSWHQLWSHEAKFFVSSTVEFPSDLKQLPFKSVFLAHNRSLHANCPYFPYLIHITSSGLGLECIDDDRYRAQLQSLSLTEGEVNLREQHGVFPALTSLEADIQPPIFHLTWGAPLQWTSKALLTLHQTFPGLRRLYVRNNQDLTLKFLCHALLQTPVALTYLRVDFLPAPPRLEGIELFLKDSAKLQLEELCIGATFYGLQDIILQKHSWEQITAIVVLDEPPRGLTLQHKVKLVQVLPRSFPHLGSIKIDKFIIRKLKDGAWFLSTPCGSKQRLDLTTFQSCLTAFLL